MCYTINVKRAGGNRNTKAPNGYDVDPKKVKKLLKKLLTNSTQCAIMNT